MEEKRAALICKALGDANRLRIIKILTSGEKCACQLLNELDITQSTLSHHMKVLAGCGLINTRYEGKWSYYSLNCEMLKAFREFIGAFICIKNDGGCTEECVYK